MKLIAESGSTKTDWVIIKNQKITYFTSQGINPLFFDKKEILDEIKNEFPENYLINEITELYFYGPGCGTKERSEIIREPLSELFYNARVSVESDLLGASRALFQKSKGIACILGTGSNSGVYNGTEITENISSTGYILGDEGSGANIGLEFIKAFLKNKIDKDISVSFKKKYNLDTHRIINKVYREAYPNRFLASLAPFIKENIKDESIYRIVKKSFSDFIEYHILPYKDSQKMPISFVGSIAYYFKDILESLVKEYEISIDRIVRKPIDDIVNYHLSN
jgi:N-acetylglucosamine kinase-like BadF-type ATPase